MVERLLQRGPRRRCFALVAAATLLLTCSTTTEASSSSSSTVLMDASGSLNKRAPAIASSAGVVTILTSPKSTNTLFGDAGDQVSVVGGGGEGGGPLTVYAPGATLTSTSLLAPATATSVAGAIIVSGITQGDLEMGLTQTRHGRTLTAVFGARLASRRDDEEEEEEKPLLILAVPTTTGEEGTEEEEASIVRDLQTILQGAAAAAEVADAVSLEDLYDVKIVPVQTQDDARRVMSMATEAATRSAVAKANGNLSSAVADAQAKLSLSTALMANLSELPRVTEAMGACREAYARQSRLARAQLAAWRGRVFLRGLVVERFGDQAEALRKRCLEQYDKDTRAAAGVSAAAVLRLDLRAQLQALLDSSIRELFATQVGNLEKSTLKRFNSELLSKLDKNEPGTANFYQDNAAALRSAEFAFDNAAQDLEVPSLALTKARVTQEMNNKLSNALMTFPDSPAAKLKTLKQIKRATSKERKPTERAIDLGLDLVAMIRPDGFGSFQGFVGYQLGGNGITVGVHNDADAPEVISQMGGVRPPFLRVQPKLRVDVEL